MSDRDQSSRSIKHLLGNLVPCLVPNEVAEPLQVPKLLFGGLPVGIVWGIVEPHAMLTYLDWETARGWEAGEIDWPDVAIKNMIRMTDSVWTKEIRDKAGDLVAVVLQHEDGLGPSRLIFKKELRSALGAKYQAVVPERSVAIALKMDLPASVKGSIEKLIHKLYAEGTNPCSEQQFDGESVNVYSPL